MTTSDITLMSYNVLQPNSLQGWWVEKYYNPKESSAYWQWPYRKQLLQDQLLNSNADILALQEAAPDSFEEDFDFLHDQYDGLCHQKARICCATFWRKDRFTLVTEQHRDRCLITILKEKNGPLIAIANCHLSAGMKPRRRFQQIHAACDRLYKESLKAPIDLFVLAGDFNEQAEETGVWKLLSQGTVEADFREERYPEREITSRKKYQHVGIFVDCYEECREDTMWVRNAWQIIFDNGTWRASFLKALDSLYCCFGQGEYLSKHQVESWIIAINGDLRGSEYEKAMALTTDQGLSRADFIQIHQQEILEGKHWAVHHYLLRFDIVLEKPHPSLRSFCLDRIWMRSERYQCTKVYSPLSDVQQSRIQAGEFPPNAWHPSDHFPLMARFSLRGGQHSSEQD